MGAIIPSEAPQSGHKYVIDRKSDCSGYGDTGYGDTWDTVTLAITPLLFDYMCQIDRMCGEKASDKFRGYCTCHRNSQEDPGPATMVATAAKSTT
jgi:hypothetical protein